MRKGGLGYQAQRTAENNKLEKNSQETESQLITKVSPPWSPRIWKHLPGWVSGFCKPARAMGLRGSRSNRTVSHSDATLHAVTYLGKTPGSREPACKISLSDTIAEQEILGFLKKRMY